MVSIREGHIFSFLVECDLATIERRDAISRKITFNEGLDFRVYS